MLAILFLAVLFAFYSRRKMMRGYHVEPNHRDYDDLAPETCVKRVDKK
jgi:hypothetical protein